MFTLIFSYRDKTAVINRYKGRDYNVSFTLAALEFQKQGALSLDDYLHIFSFMGTETNEKVLFTYMQKHFPDFIWTEIPETALA